jgi:hypothetical protein
MTNGEKFKDVFGFGADGSRVIAVNTTWWDCEFQNRKPITNADKIRAMSDEELAEFFTPFYYDGPKFYCPAQADVGEGECAVRNDCRKCWLDWLKEEAQDDQP